MGARPNATGALSTNFQVGIEPYSVVLSLTAPDIQMVVVPAMSTKATTDIAKVSFTVLPRKDAERTRNELIEVVYTGLG
jgi:hypothetical protein